MTFSRSILYALIAGSALLVACKAPTDIDPESTLEGSGPMSASLDNPVTSDSEPLVAAVRVADAVNARRPDVVVWKSPTCGCCSGWVDYLREEGFEVTTHDTENLDSVKTELGLVDPTLKSCHTAMIDGYVVEGHVPISDIDRLLAERPGIVGISAPGMPMMSPGMGSREPKDYDVMAFDESGEIKVFSRH